MTDSTALAPMDSFMERLKAKLRDDIANMLPDDVVAAMVQKVIQDEFFKPRVVPKPGRGTYSNETVVIPSKFAEMAVEAAKPIIEKHVLRLMAENVEAMENQIKLTIEDGLMTLAIKNIDDMFKTALQRHSWQLSEIVQQEMRKHGI